ncbi:MAG: hypothetical protein F6K11_07580 [Leptolyngbya sp. SIO3F4]|nr:hypothetical protein [Leptolyngbya sp. SIO3F4]
MTNNSNPNELVQIFSGFMLLMALHTAVGFFVFLIGLVIGSIVQNYSFLAFWVVIAMGFLFWQLLYVIPLVLRFRRRRQFGMMKGVIIGATLTALVNGACFVASIGGY